MRPGQDELARGADFLNGGLASALPERLAERRVGQAVDSWTTMSGCHARCGRARQSRGNSSVRLLGGDVVVVYFIGLGPLIKATGFERTPPSSTNGGVVRHFAQAGA
jgi:hypothetical protein